MMSMNDVRSDLHLPDSVKDEMSAFTHLRPDWTHQRTVNDWRMAGITQPICGLLD